MIVDTTETRVEKTLSNRLGVSGFCLACEKYTLERMGDGHIKCYSCGAEMRLACTVTAIRVLPCGEYIVLDSRMMPRVACAATENTRMKREW